MNTTSTDRAAAGHQDLDHRDLDHTDADPLTMRAAVRRTYGPAAQIRAEAVPCPRPGAGEVLLQVRAAGLDRGVWHLTTGKPYLLRLVFGLRRPRDPVLGVDVAATVVAVAAARVRDGRRGHRGRQRRQARPGAIPGRDPCGRLPPRGLVSRGRCYDLIVDIGGTRRLSRLRRALTPTGTVVLVGGEDGGNWRRPPDC